VSEWVCGEGREGTPAVRSGMHRMHGAESGLDRTSTMIPRVNGDGVNTHSESRQLCESGFLKVKCT
jgi:hypothetical protein